MGENDVLNSFKQLQVISEDIRKQQLDDIKDFLQKGQLYIWGATQTKDRILRYLRDNGIYQRPIILIDDEYYIPELGGIITLSDFLNKKKDDDVVIFGFYNYRVIMEKKIYYSKIIQNMFDFHITEVNEIRVEWKAEKISIRLTDYQQTFDLLSDDRSKVVMQKYLDAAIGGRFHELFSECYEGTAYFNRMTKDIKVDTLIDCGAFDGDSIHDFVGMFPDYNRIIAVEPDTSNLEKLMERRMNEGIRDLTVINKGVGSHEGVLHFKAIGESNSCLDDDGGNWGSDPTILFLKSRYFQS